VGQRMISHWAERLCVTTVLDGRADFVVVRRTPHRRAYLPPALTAAHATPDRLLAGYNDGSVRMWTTAEAALSHEARGEDEAAGVPLHVHEARSLLWPSSSRPGEQPNWVSALCTAGARVFSAHAAFAPSAFQDGDDDDDDDGDHAPMGQAWNDGNDGVNDRNASRFTVQDAADAHAASAAAAAAAAGGGGATGATEGAAWTGPFVAVWDAHTSVPIAALPLPAEALAAPPRPVVDDARLMPGLQSLLAPTPSPFGQRWPGEVGDAAGVVRLLAATEDGSRLVAACAPGHLVVWDSAHTGTWEAIDCAPVQPEGLAAAAAVVQGHQLLLLTGAAAGAGGARLHVVEGYTGGTQCVHDLAGCDQVRPAATPS
jgi:hypothetical protein